MAVNEGTRSEKLLEKISKKKLLASLEKPIRDQITRASKIDSEMMYNLLEETNDDEQSIEE
jgi:hypothetical protein